MLVLEELFRSQKAMSSSHFNLRFQRGLSWLKKSTDLDECPEFKFMSLWIAFRAIHVAEGEEPSALTRIFLQEIYHSDQNGRIATLLWGKLQQSILSLLHSPYLYTEFWQYQHQEINQHTWQNHFIAEKNQIENAVQQHHSMEILARIFQGLHVLHEQISLGGMSYQSAIYQKYIQESGQILSRFLPVFMYILLENITHFEVEKPFYPTISMC